MTDCTFERLSKVLDGLLEVCVNAKRYALANRGVSSRARTLLRLGVAARREARRALEASLLGEESEEEVCRHEEALVTLRSRAECLRAKKAWFSVEEARASTAARDARCADWLRECFERAGAIDAASRMAALEGAQASLRAIEKSAAFQRALLLDHVRLSPQAHDRDSLTYGTTPFVSFATILAHPACAMARRYCSQEDSHVLVVGSAAGSLCFFASALGLNAVGIEVVPTLVAVSHKIASEYPDLGLSSDRLKCADARDQSQLSPLLAQASIVVLTSACWSCDLVASICHQLKQGLSPETIVLDYAPHLHCCPESFEHRAITYVPISSCSPASTTPIHIYAKR